MIRRYVLEITVGAVSVAFFVAAVGSLLLMLRQWSDLEASVRSSAWSVAKANEDFLDVLYEIERARTSGTPTALNALTLNVDILWSRLDVLLAGEEGRLLREFDTVVEAREQLLDALRSIEPHLGSIDRLRSLEAGMSVDRLAELRPLVTDAVRETIHYALNVGDPQQTLFYHKLGIGLVLCASVSGIILIALLMREIGIHKRRQSELVSERNRAEVANRSKSRFLAMMSHELRTPLNAIIGFSESMRLETFGPLSPRYRSYVEDIAVSGAHLLNLVDQLLDIGKIASGRTELKREVFPVGEVIEEAMVLVSADSRGRAVAIDRDLVDPDWLIQMDRRCLLQILVNLLSNAVKFSHEGGTVRVLVARRDDDLTIAVADQGIGVAEQDRERVFEMFEQAGDPHQRTAGGTGIGLPVSRMLAEMHGGSLTMESSPGAGTTMHLSMPGVFVSRADVAA